MGQLVNKTTDTKSTPPANAGGQSGAVPNDQAAQTAEAERRKKAAAAVTQQKEWATALGGLLPPDAGAPTPPKLVAPPEAAFRRAIYKLGLRDPNGFTAVKEYLTAAGQDSFAKIVTLVQSNASADGAGFISLTATITMLIAASGDLGGPSTKILADLALLTEDGKQYLRFDDVGPTPPPLAKPLADFIAAKLTGEGEAAKASRDAHNALLAAIRNPITVDGGAATVDLKPKPLTGKDLERIKHIFAEVAAMFPPDKATPMTADTATVKQMHATPQQIQKLKATIATATPEVKDWLYAWTPDDGPHKGKTLLQLLNGHLSPTQLDDMTKLVDPVEQLYKDCSDNRNGRRDPKLPKVESSQLILEFLRAHNGDEATRKRVMMHTLLMQQYVQFFEEDTRKKIMRLILTGSEKESAVDKVHAAVDKGDKSAAIAAIYELGQKPADLQKLRADLIFVNRLRSLDGGSWTAGAQKGDFRGVQVSAYELFLRMCGEDPHDVKEAGSNDKQAEANPDAAKAVPLTPQERGDLDAKLYSPWAKKLADELNSWYTKDSKITGWLEEFQKKAAETEIRDLLRRAHESPGPTMSNRIQACGCDVRHRLQKGLSDGPLMQAERILGFVTDQASTGVIGGTGTLATDNKPESGKGVVGLEQALRETKLASGEVLSAVIHKSAEDIAGELNSTFWVSASKVRQFWNDYCGKVNEGVLAQLRKDTGLPRVWAIELLANAFLHVGGGTLQSKLNENLGKKDPGLIRDMGMQPNDVEARKTLAQEGAKLDNSGSDAAAKANADQLTAATGKVEQAAKLDVYKAPAKELFDGLATLGQGTADNEVLKGLGAKLKAGLALAPVTNAPANVSAQPTLAPTAEHDVGAKPGGPVHVGEAAPTDFAGFYKREYGIDPRRHAVEVAKAYANKERTPQQVGELLGVTDPSLYAPPVAPSETLEINASNQTLVAPDFTVAEAKRRADKMWKLIHEGGAVQLIRQEIDGRTQEEQRLIHIAFRQLSAGIDLSFYFQQHATHQRTGAPGILLSVGGGGVGDADKRTVSVIGDVAETEAAAELAAKGKLTIEKELGTLVKANNMDAVYKAIETASEADRRAILANSDLMTQLRQFGDDSYEWKRIWGGLTGELDLYDKLQSHAHGKHGFIGGVFGGTDEKGMQEDIKEHAKVRREAIRKQVLAADPYKGNQPKTKKELDEFNKRVTDLLMIEFQKHAENPSIRAILTDELSGTELAGMQGQVMGAGEESKVAATLHDGDWTEDEEKIIADIKKMSKEERERCRKDPQFMAQLQKAIGSQETWRDAMIALESNEDGSKGENDDNFSKLEKASRGDDQDKFEFKYEEKEVIEALSRLSPDEYKRLMADPRMQSQVLRSLEGKPELLALARSMMSFNAGDAASMTKLTVGDKADPAKGIYTRDEVERLAFLKFSAENQLKAGCSRAWVILLQAGVAVYNMKLKPGAPEGEGGGGGAPPMPQIAPPSGANGANAAPTANGTSSTNAPPQQTPSKEPNANAANANPAANADAAKEPDPKAAADGVEKRLREEIKADLHKLLQDATNGWGSQSGEDESKVSTDDKDKNNEKGHGAHKQIDSATQLSIIEKAITKEADPSNHLLMENTGFWSDDEDGIKDALRKASDDKLMRQWTTVMQPAPNESPSLKTKYDTWQNERKKAGEDQKKQPSTEPGKEPVLRKPKVGSDEWNAKMAFKAHVVDTSAMFEDLLLKWTGGLGADDTKMTKDNAHVRDNKEWLEWRTIVRDRIPNLERAKMGQVIGAATDTEAMAVLEDPNAKVLTDTLGQLAYDDEKYLVSRGEESNYNMDRLTAGGEGLALDNAMGAYRREVLTGIISDPKDPSGEDYGHLSAEEQARIAEAKGRFNQNHEQFTAAKAQVATIAASVVAIIVTAVVTILTAGTATGPLATILIGALTAGAASAGTQLTKEAIQGTDFDLGKEGLQAIARDTIMGAVTAGTTYYAGKIANAMFGVKSAAEQAARIGAIAKDPSFLAAMGRSMAENSIQSGMQGLFESGVAAFDPALWMHGWNEGWHRAGKAAGDRAREIPAEMLKAAIVAAMTHTAGSAIGKLKGGHGGGDEWHGQHAGLGNRMDLAGRAALTGKTMAKGVEDGLIMGGTEILLDEKTYRAEGQKPEEMLATMANSVSTTVQQNAQGIHMQDAAGYARAKAGAAQLQAHGSNLSPAEKKIYAEIVTKHGGTGTTVMSVAEFQAARESAPNEAIKTHEAQGGRKLTAEEAAAFREHLMSAPDLTEYLKRLDTGPSGTPGHNIPPPPKVQFKDGKACAAERKRAEEVIATLGTAHEGTTTHATATADLHTQQEAIMKEAHQLAKELTAAAKTPEDHKRLSDLVMKLNMTSSELANALADVNSSGAMKALHEQLKQALADAAAAPDDPVKHQALHALVVAAAVKGEIGPKAVEDGAAIAKKKIQELKDALELLRNERDNAARKKGHDDGPPSNSENELKNPETKDTKETKDNKETKPKVPDPEAKKDDPQKKIDESKLSESDQQKLKWFIETHGSEKGPEYFEKWKKQRFGEEANLTPEQRKAIADRVKPEAGDYAGKTVDHSFLSQEQSDIERWQTHGLEDVATDPDIMKGPGDQSKKEKAQKQSDTVRQWLNDPQFRHWYDVWMSMPDRVVVDAKGEAKVNLPPGIPAHFGEHLQAIAKGGNVGLMTRALEISKRIESEFPGLDPDPNSEAWKKARGRLVEMLGEEQVKKYENERASTNLTAEQRKEQSDRIRDLVKPSEIAKIQELCPGCQVYVTGSGGQMKKAISEVADLDLLIVVPAGTPQKARIELEHALQALKVARGDGKGMMAVDAKVMTQEQYMGFSMLPTAEGRTPMTNIRIDAHEGPVPGTGVSGGDLHNHVMGVPGTQYFIDKVGGGNATVTLEKLAHDVVEAKAQAAKEGKGAPITPVVEAQIQTALADIAQAKKLGMPPDVIENRARRALDGIFAANENTPFDHTYDIRDIAVQKHIDPNGKFENYAKDVITDLHDQGVTYSEQSVSMSKLEKRFTPEVMDEAHKKAQAEGKDSKMEFLVMAPTHETLAGDKPRSKDDISAENERLKKVLMRKDVKGMDVAGPEAKPFTETGMAWFVEKYKMLAEVAAAKGEKMVLRPHVGEGYDPTHSGEHVALAQENLKMLIKTLKDLGYNGSGDVIVRFGHATHATPEMLAEMAKLGVIVEANIGSNLATGSVLHATDHPLLANMMYGVKTVLSTDAQGVMGTTLPAEYQRAAALIQAFRDGKPLEIGGKKVYFKNLSEEQKKRFSIEWLQDQLADYKKRAGEPVGGGEHKVIEPPKVETDGKPKDDKPVDEKKDDKLASDEKHVTDPNKVTDAGKPLGPTSMGGSNTQVLGHVASEADGNALMRRLASGDASALKAVGIEPPPGFDPRTNEWGLGRTKDGKIVLIQGGKGAVDWSQIPGVEDISHSHPFIDPNTGKERKLTGEKGAETIDANSLGTTANMNDLLYLLPSTGDLRFVSVNDRPGHRVHTPYVFLGEGKIGNPKPGHTTPTVDIVIVHAEPVGLMAEGSSIVIFKAQIHLMAGDQLIKTIDIYQHHVSGGSFSADIPTLEPPSYMKPLPKDHPILKKGAAGAGETHMGEIKDPIGTFKPEQVAHLMAVGVAVHDATTKKFLEGMSADQAAVLNRLSAHGVERVTGIQDAIKRAQTDKNALADMETAAKALSEDPNLTIHFNKNGTAEYAAPTRDKTPKLTDKELGDAARERVKVAPPRQDGSPTYEWHFSDADLAKAIAEGRKLGLSDREIIDMIYIAQRTDNHDKESGAVEKKHLTVDELIGQMRVYKNEVLPQRFPNTFRSREEFEAFMKKLQDACLASGLPANDIRVQGSSIRKARDPGMGVANTDTDIAVMIDKHQFVGLLIGAFEKLPAGDRPKLSGTPTPLVITPENVQRIVDDILANPKKYNAPARTFAHAFKHQKLRVQEFPTLNAALKEVQGKYGDGKVPLTIMVRGAGMDNEPYMTLDQ